MSRSTNLNVIRVKFHGHTNRKHFVEWNGKSYAFLNAWEMYAFAEWLGGKQKTIIKLQ